MASFRDWLQLTRAHTAPLEVLIALMGASLGSGGLLNTAVLHFTVFGFLYHLAGYGQNSLEDFVRGYDTSDPHKVHHPLQRGAIPVREARRGITLLLIITFIYALLLTRLRPLPLALLAVVVLTGFIYNLKGKEMPFKFLPIALAHSTLLPFAYFSSGGEVTGGRAQVLYLAYAYLLLQITYQILIEGDVKDIEVKEASLLKRLGTTLREGRLQVPPAVKALGMGLKLLSILLAFLIWYLLDPTPTPLPMVIFLSALMLYFHFRLLKSGPFSHSRALKTMALEEVSTTFLLLTALSAAYHPAYGLPLAILIVLLSLLYFSVMNRLLWGTSLTPRV